MLTDASQSVAHEIMRRRSSVPLGAISQDSLMVADIILTRSNTPGSIGIRAGTGSGYSHAMVYVGSGYIIHSEPGGAQALKRETLEEALGDVDRAIVYRYNRPNAGGPELVRLQLERLVQQNPPITYDFAALVVPWNVAHSRNPLWGIPIEGSRDAFHCSELVAFAYQAAGMPLHHPRISDHIFFGRERVDAEYYSPGTLQMSQSLFAVGVLIDR